MSFTGADLGSAHGKVLMDVADAVNGLNQVKGSLNDLGTAGQNAGAGTAAVGLGMLGISRILGGFLGDAVSTTIDFDHAISGVGAVANATTEELAAMRDLAVDLGNKTQFSATEAAFAMEELAKAGVSSENILSGAAEAAVDLAAASGTDLATSAMIAAQAMNAFNISAEESGRIADVLTNGANQSATSVEELGIGIGQVGGIAHLFGFSIEEVVGALGLMANRGISAARGATSMKYALQRIAAPAGRTKKAIEELGLEFYDQQGNMKDLAGIAAELTEKTKGLTNEERNRYLTMLGGADAMRFFLVLMEEGVDGVNDMVAAMGEEGTAADATAARIDNLWGDLEKLRSAIQSAQIALVDAFTPALRAIIQPITDVIQAFADANPVIQKITAFLLLLATAFLAVKGAMLLAKTEIGGFVAQLVGLGEANIIATLLSFLPVLAAIVAIIAGLTVAYKTNLGGFGDWVDGLISDLGKISGAAGPVLDLLGQLFDPSIAEGDAWRGKEFGKNLADLHVPLQKLGLSQESVKNVIHFISQMSAPMSKAALAVKDLGNSFRLIGGILSGKDIDPKKMIYWQKAMLRVFGGATGTKILNGTRKLRQSFVGFDKALDAAFGGGIGSLFNLQNVLDFVFKNFSRFVDWLVGTAVPAFGKLLVYAIEALTFALDFLARHMETISTVIGLVVDIILGPFRTALAVIKQLLQGDIAGALDALAEGVFDAFSSFAELGSMVVDALPQLGAGLLSIGGDIYQWIKDQLGVKDGTPLEVLEAGAKATVDAIAELGGDLKAMEGRFVDWLMEKIFGNGTTTIGEAGSGAGALEDIGGGKNPFDLGVLIVEGLMQLGGDLARVAGRFWDWFKEETGFFGGSGGPGSAAASVHAGMGEPWNIGTVFVEGALKAAGDLFDWGKESGSTLQMWVEDQLGISSGGWASGSVSGAGEPLSAGTFFVAATLTAIDELEKFIHSTKLWIEEQLQPTLHVDIDKLEVGMLDWSWSLDTNKIDPLDPGEWLGIKVIDPIVAELQKPEVFLAIAAGVLAMMILALSAPVSIPVLAAITFGVAVAAGIQSGWSDNTSIIAILAGAIVLLVIAALAFPVVIPILAAAGLAALIIGAIKGAFFRDTQWKDIPRQIWESLKSGLQEKVPGVYDFAVAASDFVTNFVDAIISEIGTKFGRVWDAVLSHMPGWLKDALGISEKGPKPIFGPPGETAAPDTGGAQVAPSRVQGSSIKGDPDDCANGNQVCSSGAVCRNIGTESNPVNRCVPTASADPASLGQGKAAPGLVNASSSGGRFGTAWANSATQNMIAVLRGQKQPISRALSENAGESGLQIGRLVGNNIGSETQKAIGNKALDIGRGIGRGVAAPIPSEIASTIKKSGNTVSGAIKTIFSGSTAEMREAARVLGEGISDRKAMEEVGTNMGSSIRDGLVASVRSGIGSAGAGNIANDVKDTAGGVGTITIPVKMKLSFDSGAGGAGGIDAPKDTGGVEGIVSQMQSTIAAATPAIIESFRSAGSQAGLAFQQALATGLITANNSVQVSANLMTSRLQQFVVDAAVKGQDAGQQFQQNLANGLITANNSVEVSKNLMTSKLESFATTAGQKGTSAGRRFADGLFNGLTTAYIYALGAARDIANALSFDLYGQGYSSGSSFGAGLRDGASAYSDVMYNIGVALGNSLNAGADSVIKPGSPSRTGRALGGSYGEGLAVGASSWINDLFYVGTNLANALTQPIPQPAFANVPAPMAATVPVNRTQPTTVNYFVALTSDDFERVLGKAERGEEAAIWLDGQSSSASAVYGR